MALAVIQEQNLTDIADAIRAKNGTSDTYMPSQMAGAIDNLPQPSGTIQITQNGTVDVAQYASAEVSVQGVDTLKLLLDARGTASSLFQSATTLTDATNIINYNATENCTSCSYMFRDCSALEIIPLFDTRRVTSVQSMFVNCRQLASIPAFDFNNVVVTQNAFQNCVSLTAIHIINIGASLDIHWSTAMTASACLEVMGNLKQVSTTQTLTLPSAVQSGISQSDIDAANAKGWTIAFA